MSGIFLLATLIAVVWLFFWSIKNERSSHSREDRSPFAIRDHEDYRKRYGDKNPF